MRALLAALLVAGGWFATPPALSAQEEPLVITGGRWFDDVSGALRPNAGLVALRGRLLSVDGVPSDIDLASVQRLVLNDDEVVLPGLIDLHAHYNVQLFGMPRREELVATPVLWLANGVTSTFPAGEYDPEGMWQLRLRIQRGEHPGPRLHNSGPYFGRTRPGWTQLDRDSLFAEVDLWASRGVRGFKAKNADPETLGWLIERAHHHGLSVTGHLDSGVGSSVNPRDAILMGIDRIEHFLGGPAFPPDRSAYASFPDFRPDQPEFREIVDLFLAYDVTYNPTITAYAYYGIEGKSHPALDFWTDERRFLSPAVREWVGEGGPDFNVASFDDILAVKCPLVRAFHEAGGRLALATDHPSWGVWLPGFVAHRELHAMSLCGIPNADVLRIATRNGAEALGISDRLGTIATGKLADLFVIQGDPLVDIRATRHVRWVVKSGTLYESSSLLESVEGRFAPAGRR